LAKVIYGIACNPNLKKSEKVTNYTIQNLFANDTYKYLKIYIEESGMIFRSRYINGKGDVKCLMLL
jgi:hypothetical protein